MFLSWAMKRYLRGRRRARKYITSGAIALSYTTHLL